MVFRVSKTYGHELGLSACFRQWRAIHSHCSHLHGYALAFKITFEANTLDECNWVVDFGGLKEIKQFLVDTFDHKLLVANDDPAKHKILDMASGGIADVTIMSHLGCDQFARYVGEHVIAWLDYKQLSPRVRLYEVECSEHGANSASFLPTADQQGAHV